jgi:hypothetical protein
MFRHKMSTNEAQQNEGDHWIPVGIGFTCILWKTASCADPKITLGPEILELSHRLGLGLSSEQTDFIPGHQTAERT